MDHYMYFTSLLMLEPPATPGFQVLCSHATHAVWVGIQEHHVIQGPTGYEVAKFLGMPSNQ